MMSALDEPRTVYNQRPVPSVFICSRDGQRPDTKGKEKERCSGSYRQAVGFLVIKDDGLLNDFL